MPSYGPRLQQLSITSATRGSTSISLQGPPACTHWGATHAHPSPMCLPCPDGGEKGGVRHKGGEGRCQVNMGKKNAICRDFFFGLSGFGPELQSPGSEVSLFLFAQVGEAQCPVSEPIYSASQKMPRGAGKGSRSRQDVCWTEALPALQSLS